MVNDAELLHRYATSNSDEAFTELVTRHINLVYSAALSRLDGDRSLAEDITQHVFIALARDASRLEQHPTLAGWLYVSTRHAAANALREKRSRKRRDESVHDMDIAPSSSAAHDWSRIRPELDQLIEALEPRDRDAVILRFFEGRRFTEIGDALCISPDAARMRVDRALLKLQALLGGRGISSSAEAVGLALDTSSCAAAPAGLAAIVAVSALGHAPTGAAGTSILHHLLHFMTATKTGTAAAMVLLIFGTGSAVYEYRLTQVVDSDLAASREAAARLRHQLTESERQNAALQIAVADLRRRHESSQPRSEASSTNGAQPLFPLASNRTLTPSEAMYFDWQKSKAEDRVAAEFHRLGLSQEQLEKYGKLVTDAALAEWDAGKRAAAAGMSVSDYKAQLQNALDQELRQMMGDARFEQFRRDGEAVQLTSKAQSVFSDVSTYLRAEDVPLDGQVAVILLHVLSQNASALTPDSANLPASLLVQVQNLLSPAQLAAWQRMLATRQHYQELVKAATKP